MKKFKFTLETLERVKDTEKTRQETMLSKAQQALDSLCEQKEGLLNDFEAHNFKFSRQMDRGLNGRQICAYNNYSTYLRESIQKLEGEIEEAAKQRDGCRKALIQTMKEIQTLDKLKSQQYKKHIEEVRREEEKSIGDFVAYQVTSA